MSQDSAKRWYSYCYVVTLIKIPYSPPSHEAACDGGECGTNVIVTA